MLNPLKPVSRRRRDQITFRLRMLPNTEIAEDKQKENPEGGEEFNKLQIITPPIITARV